MLHAALFFFIKNGAMWLKLFCLVSFEHWMQPVSTIQQALVQKETFNIPGRKYEVLKTGAW